MLEAPQKNNPTSLGSSLDVKRLRRKLKRELEEESDFLALNGTFFYKLRHEEERARSDYKQHSETDLLVERSHRLQASEVSSRPCSPLQQVYTPEEPIVALQVSKVNSAESQVGDEGADMTSVPSFDVLSESSEDTFPELSSPNFDDPFDVVPSQHQKKKSDPFADFDGFTQAVHSHTSAVQEAAVQRSKRVLRIRGRIETGYLPASIPTSRQARQARFQMLPGRHPLLCNDLAADIAQDGTQSTAATEPVLPVDEKPPHIEKEGSWLSDRATCAEIQSLKDQLAFYKGLYAISQQSPSVMLLAQEASGRIICRRRADAERIAFLIEGMTQLRAQASRDSFEIAALKVVKEGLVRQKAALKQGNEMEEQSRVPGTKDKINLQALRQEMANSRRGEISCR